MAHDRRLRFAMQLSHAPTGRTWAELAKKAEGEGYDVISLADHLGEQFGPLAALGAAAAATESVRLSMFVLANDLRHPAVLAKEIATLDVISAGRVELGLGAGWNAAEFDAMGITFDRPATRIQRLEEAVSLLRSLLTGRKTTFAGSHYQTRDLEMRPMPVQARIPFVLGGGGRRMLALAARQADTVSISTDNRARTSSGGVNESIGWPTVARQIDWVREVSGPRFDDLEINFRVLAVAVTQDREGAARRLSSQFGAAPAVLLGSPFLFIGSRQEIEEQVHRARHELGVSYYTVSQRHAERAAPLVAALANR